MSRQFLCTFLLPGVILQSIMISYGYGSGQDLRYFFLSQGPRHGLYSLVFIVTPLISLVAVLTFEFARIFQAYNYRAFFRHLLGKAWFLWELAYLVTLMLLFALIGAATGEIFAHTPGLPETAASETIALLFLLVVTAWLVYHGTGLIERMLVFGSVVLYLTYLAFLIWSLALFGENISTAWQWQPRSREWAQSGLHYASLQLGLLPVVLFALRHIKTRRQAVLSGLLAGPMALIPAILLYLVMLMHYPDIPTRTAPSAVLLAALQAPWFALLFHGVLLGTLIETGAGAVHAVNERLADYCQATDKKLPPQVRPISALLLPGIAGVLSKIGLAGSMALAANTVAAFLLLCFLLPLILIGIPKMIRAGAHQRG